MQTWRDTRWFNLVLLQKNQDLHFRQNRFDVELRWYVLVIQYSYIFHCCWVLVLTRRVCNHYHCLMSCLWNIHILYSIREEEMFVIVLCTSTTPFLLFGWVGTWKTRIYNGIITWVKLHNFTYIQKLHSWRLLFHYFFYKLYKYMKFNVLKMIAWKV